MRIESNLIKYKDKKIAVYGLGDNARVLAGGSNNLNLSCLVAKDHIGEEKYGLRILSIEDAIKEAEVIVIAASFSVTSIIFSRIKDIVPTGMPILNMFGENLSTKDPFENDFYWLENYEQFLKEIDAHEVISFDVFDTLIMRDVIEPSDIFRIIANKCDIPDFLSVRVDSEKRCRLNDEEPTLDDIYDYIEEERLLGSVSIENLQRLEYSAEIEHILPRRRVIEALEYALKNNKTVFLTSDMYLSKEKILTLLSKCGIDGKYELLVSCEYRCSKFTGNLYDVLIEKAGSTNILHIGDDGIVDRIMAEERGVDSYIIRTSYEMLAKSAAAFIFDDIKNIADKDYLGYYLSDVLNDPFAMYGLKGKLRISSERDIAVLLFPITKLFIDFIIRNSFDYDCVLFPSRDGYYLYEEYCKYKISHPELKLPDAKYIYASRMALSRVALRSENSFDVLTCKLFGNLAKNCKKYIKEIFSYELPEEYNLSCGELINKWGKEGLIDNLHRFVPDMVEELYDVSYAYTKYIESLNISQYNRIVLVDIVSYGTQPYCLSEVLGKPIDMIAIGSTGIPNVFLDENRVRSIYGNVNEEVNGTIITKTDMSVLHLFLEVLYSSRDGQFLEISEAGEAKFVNGSEYNTDLLDGVQNELSQLLESCESNRTASFGFSPEFCHGMLRILRKRFSSISDDLRRKFEFSDPYEGGFAVVNLIDSL